MRVLAGDIGGTHARLAVYDVTSDRRSLLCHETYQSRNYESLDQVVQKFMADVAIKIEAACFGVAGPVINDQIMTSNLAWVVQRAALQETLSTTSVWLLNDLEAAAHGIDELDPSQLIEVNAGKAARGNRAVLFCGTGLGEALSIWNGNEFVSSASEGGHCSFSPRDRAEMELCEYLADKFGHVSWERVLSGPGITNLYEFLQFKEPIEEPSWFLKEMKEADPSIAIMKAASSGELTNCRKARDLFVRFLAREAGDLALKCLARGGVYLGGGVISHIGDLLKRPEFMDEFSRKGRMRELLADIPVNVILSDDAGILGAARFAARSLSKKQERKTA